MKIYGKLLAFLPLWGATAFVVQGPKGLTSKLAAARQGQGPQDAARTFDWADPDIARKQASKLSRQPGSSSSPTTRLENRLANMKRSGRPNRSGPNAAERPAPRENRNNKTANAGQVVAVQGGSLKTWSFMSQAVERVQVSLTTDGRPLETDIELWQGPDNTPTKMRVYVEDGKARPFNAVMETPRGPNTIAIRNTAQMEFPFYGRVVADRESASPMEIIESGDMRYDGIIIQGGALRTFSFNPEVESVQVMLRTDGRPLNARIELLQGPNNNKQVIELYTEDGLDRPFFAVIETPGSGNVVRIVNTATVEFPLMCYCEAHTIGEYDDFAPVMGGDDAGSFMDMQSRPAW